MGKIPLFTREQRLIFDQVSREAYLCSDFYFTGGTALSVFYFGHRYSEDLDFFSEKRFDFESILSLVSKWSKQHGFTFNIEQKQVVTICILKFADTHLKVDFGYYPHARVESGKIVSGITIDSLWDIAINKLLTINQRSSVKDFVDLYFILKRFTIWDLIHGVKVKFNREIDPWLLSVDLTVIETFNTLPRMIKPLTLDTLKKFFRNLAKQLAHRVVE